MAFDASAGWCVSEKYPSHGFALASGFVTSSSSLRYLPQVSSAVRGRYSLGRII